jgi:hypothetical protein
MRRPEGDALMAGISNHYDTLTAVKSIVDGLSLSGLTGGSVIQEVATYQDGQTPLPFISISPYGPEKLGDELNDRDGVYYGVAVCIVGKPAPISLEQRLGWRQTLRRNLNNHQVSGLSMNYNLVVEPGNVVEPKAWFDRNAFVSGFVVRAYFQEPRI